MYTYTYIHKHIHTYVHIYIHTYMHTYTYIHRHTNTHTHRHTDTQTHTHAHTHTHTHIHHTQTLSAQSGPTSFAHRLAAALRPAVCLEVVAGALVARTARRVRLLEHGLVEPEEGRHDARGRPQLAHER